MSVFLSNLDDFINPSQACVNPPVLGGSSKEHEQQQSININPKKRITIQADFSVNEFEEKQQKPSIIRSKGSADKQVATVSLNDCLACSGCVTSAESVLIMQQSYHKLLEALRDDSLVVVVALSPQSTASLAHHLGSEDAGRGDGLSACNAFLRLASALKSIGAAYVVDSACAGDIALLETREEFLQRYRHHHNNQGVGARTAGGAGMSLFIKPGPVSSALSATRIKLGGQEVSTSPASLHLPLPLPLLVSACPGWVCYAEKMQPEVLPFLSTVKSPQQILGALVKKVFRRDFIHGICGDRNKDIMNPDKRIYMVCVQPCFDKKLEASRLDFYHDDLAAPEIDLVLSTTELWNLLEEVCGALVSRSPPVSVREYVLSHPEDTLQTTTAVPAAGGVGGAAVVAEKLLRSVSADARALFVSAELHAGSGGYMEYLARELSHLQGTRAPVEAGSGDIYPRDAPALQFKAGRNKDVSEVEVSFTSHVTSSLSGVPESSSKVKLGLVYGFRNIQSLMLKMKRGRVDGLQFAEVMACPSGCPNGGGQIKLAAASSSSSSSSSSVQERVSESHDRIQAVNALMHPHPPIGRVGQGGGSGVAAVVWAEETEARPGSGAHEMRMQEGDKVVEDIRVRRPEDSPLVRFLYVSVSAAADSKSATSGEDMPPSPCGLFPSPFSSEARLYFHTRFHVVPKLEVVAPLAAKW